MDERRSFNRTECIMPVSTSSSNSCFHSVNISESGMCLDSKEILPVNKSIDIRISVFPKISLNKKVKIMWSKYCVDGDSYRYGVALEDGDIDKIDRESMVSLFELLDAKFVSLTIKMQKLLAILVIRLEEFSQVNSQDDAQISLIENSKNEIFSRITEHFDSMWDIVKDFSQERYLLHRSYYQAMLGSYILHPIEINSHIHKKPLGYAGDFMIMNYIYDYHEGNYLGKNLFERLVNNYTCNIDIAKSNVKRKQYFKEKISEVIEQKESPNILSVACGSAREVVELLEEGKINKAVNFTFLDIEQRALSYIKDAVANILHLKSNLVSFKFECKNVLELIKFQKKSRVTEQYDLIYVSGLFDYLGDRVITLVLKSLFHSINPDGKLIVCNADKNNARHRVYYEMLGQ